MEDIRVVKAGPKTAPQLPTVSPFGLLSDAFNERLLARQKLANGLYRFYPLEFLAEEEAGETRPIAPVYRLNFQFNIENPAQKDSGEAALRERVLRLVERTKLQAAPRGRDTIRTESLRERETSAHNTSTQRERDIVTQRERETALNRKDTQTNAQQIRETATQTNNSKTRETTTHTSNNRSRETALHTASEHTRETASTRHNRTESTTNREKEFATRQNTSTYERETAPSAAEIRPGKDGASASPAASAQDGTAGRDGATGQSGTAAAQAQPSQATQLFFLPQTAQTHLHTQETQNRFLSQSTQNIAAQAAPSFLLPVGAPRSPERETAAATPPLSRLSSRVAWAITQNQPGGAAMPPAARLGAKLEADSNPYSGAAMSAFEGAWPRFGGAAQSTGGLPHFAELYYERDAQSAENETTASGGQSVATLVSGVFARALRQLMQDGSAPTYTQPHKVDNVQKTEAMQDLQKAKTAQDLQNERRSVASTHETSEKITETTRDLQSIHERQTLRQMQSLKTMQNLQTIQDTPEPQNTQNLRRAQGAQQQQILLAYLTDGTAAAREAAMRGPLGQGTSLSRTQSRLLETLRSLQQTHSTETLRSTQTLRTAQQALTDGNTGIASHTAQAMRTAQPGQDVTQGLPGQSRNAGQPGRPGQSGDAGQPGTAGQAGQSGLAGATSAMGLPGRSGQAGQHGALGATGLTGAQGTMGLTGLRSMQQEQRREILLAYLTGETRPSAPSAEASPAKRNAATQSTAAMPSAIVTPLSSPQTAAAMQRIHQRSHLTQLQNISIANRFLQTQQRHEMQSLMQHENNTQSLMQKQNTAQYQTQNERQLMQLLQTQSPTQPQEHTANQSPTQTKKRTERQGQMQSPSQAQRLTQTQYSITPQSLTLAQTLSRTQGLTQIKNLIQNQTQSQTQQLRQSQSMQAAQTPMHARAQSMAVHLMTESPALQRLIHMQTQLPPQTAAQGNANAQTQTHAGEKSFTRQQNPGETAMPSARSGQRPQAAAMPPLPFGELTLAPTAAQMQPAPPPPPPVADAKSQRPGQPSRQDSDYVKSLPQWARSFLEESDRPGTAAKNTLGRSGAMDMRTAAPMHAPSAAKDGQMVWTAPGFHPTAQKPVNTVLRQKDETPAPPPPKMSNAEVNKMANKVYDLVMERVNRERRRMGL